MLQMLKRRIDEMRTIKTLCTDAERHANADGAREPGLEHFLLAALDLPDGTARRAFVRAGADPDGFKAAVARQYADALAGIGIAPDAAAAVAPVPVAPASGPYRARPQVETLMRTLAAREDRQAGTALLGAHVVATIAAQQHGVAARALARMGLAEGALERAARAEAGVEAAARA